TAQSALCSCLSPRDLAALLACSRLINAEVSAYCRRAFSINRILQPYFRSPDSFRVLQSTTGTLISGSAALQFFDRTEYPSSDLDLYVEHRYVARVVAFLQNEGYTFQAWTFQPPTVEETLVEISRRIQSHNHMFGENGEREHYTGGGLAGVLHFHKGDREIQLMAARASPLTIIYGFHSTCVMNIITHEKAYSLFPLATFEKREALIIKCQHERERDQIARQKYLSRGWTMV
ncbi:hypothetical protein K488DRAFT_15199, partial [Vararia minispora EC-137]